MNATNPVTTPTILVASSISTILNDVDVLVGIPTRDEADCIAATTTVVDEGLTRYLPDCRAVIVNLDNCSSDGTGRRFQDTSTATPKLYCSTPSGVVGKGSNVVNLVHLAHYCDARAVALIDADVRTATPVWIPRLLAPVLDGYADFVHPSYRTSQGGPLTNMLCYPIVRGLFDAAIRQPIGGEFAFSASFVRHLADKPLPISALGYGIDIHLTIEAVALDFAIASAPLGCKDHRRRPWHTIGPIATEVATSLAAQLRRHRAMLWDRSARPECWYTPGSRGGPKARPDPSTDLLTRPASVELGALSRTVHDRLATWPNPEWPLLPVELRSAATLVRQGRHLTPSRWVQVLLSWAAATACDVPAVDAYGEAIVPLLLARAYWWERERRAPAYPGDDITIEALTRSVADARRAMFGGPWPRGGSIRP